MRIIQAILFGLSSLFFAHTALSGNVVRLIPGQSFSIGDTQIMCSSGNDNCYMSPMETKVCVRKDSFNRCKVYDTTYTVPRGASCTAECVRFDDWDACVARSVCQYQNNCCFIKKVCAEFDDWNRCIEWNELTICN